MGKNKNRKGLASSKETEKASKPLKKNMKQGVSKPKEDHMQEIPFRLREIMRSKEQMKKGSRKKKKLKQASLVKDTQKSDGDIPVPHFKRKKEESVRAYLGRMEEAARHVLFLTKNQVDRNPELEPEQQEKPADKGKSEKKKQYNKDRALKVQQKKFDKQVTRMEKERFIDDVPFGEVSMAPPSFTAKPRKAQDKSKNRPKDLLLNSLLGQSVVSTVKPSMARQRIMEEERQRVVEAYRHMKKLKQLKQQPQEKMTL